MKTIKISYTILTGAFLLILAACNKGKDDFLYKETIAPVMLKGYNSSNETLEIKLDTFKINYPLSPNSAFDLIDAYTFYGNTNKVKLSLTETGTGKVVLEKEIKRGDGPTNLKFLYLNGKVNDLPEKPLVEQGKIKISYLFMPTLTNYTAPVDIVLIKYYFTPKAFEEIIRIKNVKPYECSEPVTISSFPTSGQEYNGQPTSVLFKAYIYKAGTNEFYTEGTGYTWHATSSSAPTPPASVASSNLYIFNESTAGNSIRFTKLFEL